MTCYSLDLRKRVIIQLSEGMSIAEVSQLFNITRQTIYNWEKLHKKNQLKPRDNCMRRPKKVSQESLENHIKKHPDATLGEIAKHFNCAASSIHYRIKKGKITYKKKSFYILKEMKKKGKHTRSN